MFTFEPVTEEFFEVVKEIVNSNDVYNTLENGCEFRTDDEIREEFFHNDNNRVTYFIKADETYVGLVEYMKQHEKDGRPWLGLLMIHRDYQGYGYGTNAYYMLEDMWKQQGITSIRLAVIKGHTQAKRFWEHLGFSFYAQKQSTKGITVDCLEKNFTVSVFLRRGEERDVQEITNIYNDAVLHTTATFDLDVKSVEERRIWFSKYNEQYPLLVAERFGNVIGYACLSPFREKEAYKQTVEISVYVHKEARGIGVAKQLVARIIDMAKDAGYHVIIAGITKGNDASVHLHEQFGFTHAGTFREVGYKFGQWQDVMFYELLI
ncbi:GNAT family N-acetyltransferase [Ectobacillus sp. JY-23]|uniref:GNAT family N-acetyltransferase n=1 Tax=Ectobacillus sp. JY-23 TaxID=2933872 RepID=UPI0034A0184A